MRITNFLAAALLVVKAAAAAAARIGFTTYKEIREGFDNSAAIEYSSLDRSSTLFLYIQIVAGQDHQQTIDDFRVLAQNYGSNGVAVIPRVRYGNSGGSVVAEPSNSSVILNDAATWAAVFAGVSGTIEIPVIQAGFLGLWGEWHDGPFCPVQGTDDSAENLEIKRQVIETLQQGNAGRKIALRYPRDHQALFPDDRTVTLHNDCIFNGGPQGTDGGTFPGVDEPDRQQWIDYTMQVGGGNSYGGEGCDQAGDSAYNWTDWTDLCGDNGLVPYINRFQVAYMNPGNPAPLQDLFNDDNWSDCVDSIQIALQQHI